MPINEIGGPTSEVFYEFESIKHDKKFGEKCHPNCDCGRFLEIGNSVFMVYKKTKDGLGELPNKNVDFGGGLERLVMAVNDNPDLYQIDVFQRFIGPLEALTGKSYDSFQREMRIVADHIRASEALVKTDVVPGNKLQGYVLRRLIRRAAVKMRNLKGNLQKTDLSFDFTDGVRQVVEEEVERLVAGAIEQAAPGGRFILSPCASPYERPLPKRASRNFIHYLKMGRKYGYYPLPDGGSYERQGE